MFLFDSTFILLIPAIVLAVWAQIKVRSSYRRYSRIRSTSGMSGQQVAKYILRLNGRSDVQVEGVAGELSDHYDPRDRTVRLSPGIYNVNSVAALGIAAHEVGHALQHADGYAPLHIRHALLGPANFGSTLAFPIFFIGFIFGSLHWLMDLGIILFTAALAFQLVTLPVEFDASRRALANLRTAGLMADDEVSMARKVLVAASWTYVAAAAMSLTHLLRMLILRGDE